MIESIKLFIEARTLLQSDLIPTIQDVSKNSLSELLYTNVSADNIFVTIQTTSDKLEHLGYKLSSCGIEIAENAVHVLKKCSCAIFPLP
jgi:hypothetical protein